MKKKQIYIPHQLDKNIRTTEKAKKGITFTFLIS